METVPGHCGDMSQDSNEPTPALSHPSDVTPTAVPPLRPAVRARVNVIDDPASRRGKAAFDTLTTSAVGLEMGVAVIIGLLIGRWLDGELGSEPYLMILFTIFGFVAGIRGLIRGARRAERAEQAAAERGAR